LGSFIQSNTPRRRRDFSREFNLLGRQSRDVGLNARYVSSWASIAGNQAEMNRVRERATDNRYRRRRLSGFDGLQCRRRGDDIGFDQSHHLFHGCYSVSKHVKSLYDINVSVLLVTELRETLNKIAER
jgi:hypothetical protein